jgi:hypothetical protein
MTEAGCRVILPVCDTRDVLNYGIPCIHSFPAARARCNIVHYRRPPSEHFVDDRSACPLAQENPFGFVSVHIKSMPTSKRDWHASEEVPENWMAFRRSQVDVDNAS